MVSDFFENTACPAIIDAWGVLGISEITSVIGQACDALISFLRSVGL